VIVALLRMTEQLLVFGEDPADDRCGPYHLLAPELLELPDGAVRWLAESPDGRVCLDVPARFIAALIEGEVDEAATLLHAAIEALPERIISNST